MLFPNWGFVAKIVTPESVTRLLHGKANVLPVSRSLWTTLVVSRFLITHTVGIAVCIYTVLAARHSLREQAQVLDPMWSPKQHIIKQNSMLGPLEIFVESLAACSRHWRQICFVICRKWWQETSVSGDLVWCSWEKKFCLPFFPPSWWLKHTNPLVLSSCSQPVCVNPVHILTDWSCANC